MGGAIISELGGGIIPLRGAASSRNWGAASSGISNEGNPRPFCIVAKNLSTSHDRDIFADILIGDEILCHVSLGRRSRQSKRRRR